MIKRFYCTHFDINYSAHARSLVESLLRVAANSYIFVFCMDDESFIYFTNIKLKNVIVTHYSKLESTIPGLLNAKNNRTAIEYFYTCSPVICNYVITNFEGINEITYLDSDLFFFTDPEPIDLELKESSIGIIEHKFSFLARRNRVYGNFNVGWITFKNDINGILCLNKWMENCIDWCYQKVEFDRYADQKYLDFWVRDFNGVHVIKNIGANLALWNIGNYKIRLIDDQVYVDDKPLIFYHFAGLKQIEENIFRTELSSVFLSCKGVIKNYIYLPYIKSLKKYLNKNSIIISKKDSHASRIGLFLRNIIRKTRQYIFPDLINLNND